MSINVFRKSGFLSPETCAAVRHAMDTGQAEEAEVLGTGIEWDVAVRRASLIEPAQDLIDQVETSFDAERDRIGTFFGTTLRGREGAGFIRYPSGGFYRPHRDRGDHAGWEMAAHRVIAVVTFLNSSRDGGGEGEFDGGVLRLLLADGSIDVVPEAGLLVAFPADVLHEVTEVRGGTRDTVVDWFYGKAHV